MLPKESNTLTAQLISATIGMLSAVCKLMITIQLGGKIISTLTSSELGLALGSSLESECPDAKFVEVAFSDALSAIDHVSRVY